MSIKMTLVVLIAGLYTGGLHAQEPEQSPHSETRGGHAPPPQAYEDCRGRKSGDKVQHATPDGVVAATCLDSPDGLVARPDQGRGPGQGSGPGTGQGSPGERASGQGTGRDSPDERGPGNQPRGQAMPQDGGRKYSLEQAISDRAQLNTIAFDGLAFLTGDFGYDTFLPPGKVSDYFGFQYIQRFG
jgi:hypothetical protein